MERICQCPVKAVDHESGKCPNVATMRIVVRGTTEEYNICRDCYLIRTHRLIRVIRNGDYVIP